MIVCNSVTRTLRSVRPGQPRGTTSISEVVPLSACSTTWPRAQPALAATRPGARQSPVRAPLRGTAASRRSRRAALCAAPVGARVDANTGHHGVSDPGWRARFRPARVRKGRSRHGCQCRSRCRYGPGCGWCAPLSCGRYWSRTWPGCAVGFATDSAELPVRRTG